MARNVDKDLRGLELWGSIFLYIRECLLLSWVPGFESQLDVGEKVYLIKSRRNIAKY